MKVSSHAYLNLCWLNLYLTEVYTIIISRSVCSNYEDSHQEIASLKSIFKRNSHPYFFVNHCIKKFLNQLFIHRDLNFLVPKRELICVLLYLGKNVFDLRVRLTRIIEGNLPYCQLKVIFRSKGRLNTLFRFKDLLENKNPSFYIRVAEHMGISILTGKCLKNVKHSPLSDHILQCNCTLNLDDFDILASDSSKFKLLFGESFFYKAWQPYLKQGDKIVSVTVP